MEVMRETTSGDKFRALREQAEKLLAEMEGRGRDTDRHNLRALLQELEVHQVELELQNRELRRAQADLEASRDELADLYESAPVGYVTLSRKGLVEKANTAAHAIVGSEHEMTGRPLSSFVARGDWPAFYDHLHRTASRERTGPVELEVPGQERTVHVQAEAVPETDGGGGLRRWRVSLVDISERKRSEEARFQRAFENAAVGMVHISGDGKVVHANQKLCDILGYSKEELRGKHLRELTHPKDLEKDLRLLTQLIDGRIERYATEKRWLRNDGATVWIRLTAAMQSPEMGIGVVEDITEQKRLEEELQGYRNELEERVGRRTAELAAESEQRRFLAKRLVDLLEEDRRSLALMLHEDAGQRLAGAKMELENLQRDLRYSDPVVSEQLDRVSEYLQDVIGSLRDSSRRLRPTALDVLGLVTALRTLGDGRQMGRQSIDFSFQGVPAALDRNLEIAIFRIAQEAVTNAITHAGCDRIHLSLLGQDDKLLLTIEDNGRGFVPEPPGVRDAFGLVIMRERAANVGGELRVGSTPGIGTTVAAEFPVRERSE
jgi:two-component system sensor histidine kinase UhpB